MENIDRERFWNILKNLGEFQNKLTKRETYRPSSGKMSKESWRFHAYA